MTQSGRIDALIDRLGDDLTEADFRALAMACVDRACVGSREQEQIRRILEADALAMDAVIARLAGLDVISPAPGWEERAVERWQIESADYDAVVVDVDEPAPPAAMVRITVRRSASHLEILRPGSWSPRI